ncbi:MAG: GAF domain-containing sensor histidine kinase [Candidatus Dormibacteria bacterium]
MHRQRSELDLITQYLEVYFDDLAGELAELLSTDRPATLRRAEGAAHLRGLIRELVARRSPVSGLTDGLEALRAVSDISDAERALLEHRIQDIVDRARQPISARARQNEAKAGPRIGSAAVGFAAAPDRTVARPREAGWGNLPTAEPPVPVEAVVAVQPFAPPVPVAPVVPVVPVEPPGAAPITERAGLGAAGIQPVLMALATKALELLQADLCQVFLEDGEVLSLQAEAPERIPSLGPLKLSPAEGFAAHVRASGRSLSVEAVDLLEGNERTWAERGALNVAAVPVGAPGEAGAGLLVAVRVTMRPFGHGEMMAMARLADEVTLAMASADLLSRAEELAVLKERMKLAREIHDGLAADLSAVVQMFKYHEHRRRVDPADADELLVQMRELVQGALQSARDILATLRPRQAPPRQLAESVKHQVDTFSRTYGVSGATRISGVDSVLVAEEREAIHQVVREALTNIRKHSQCAAVQVTLDMRERPFVLVVEDDGVGIDLGALEEKSGSFGILGMRERAQLLGGTLTIGNGPMGGVRLEFHGPLVPLGV